MHICFWPVEMYICGPYGPCLPDQDLCPLGSGVGLKGMVGQESQLICEVGKICLLPLFSSSGAITVIMHIIKYVSLISMHILFDSDI